MSRALRLLSFRADSKIVFSPNYVFIRKNRNTVSFLRNY